MTPSRNLLGLRWIGEVSGGGAGRWCAILRMEWAASRSEFEEGRSPDSVGDAHRETESVRFSYSCHSGKDASHSSKEMPAMIHGAACVESGSGRRATR